MHHLSVRNLWVHLDGHPILKSISFEARSGEFIGLIGPNGSGKSTMLRTLSGLLPFQQGDVYINQLELSTFSPKKLARLIGYVPQDTTLGFDFTVRDIVLMGRHVHIPRFGLESRCDYKLVDEAMSRTSITNLADRFVTQLSGGQRQMAFIAKALAQQPGILLFDEPVSALDINRQLQVLELIRALADEGILAVAALHDLNLAARFCDRLLLLQNGELTACGSPDEVLNAETLLSSYQVAATVRHDDAVDAATVTALRYEETCRSSRTKPFPSVFVIGGAGKAAKLLALLYRLNCQVTIGPLEEHDPDARLARELGMKVIAYPSFSRFSPEALQQCRTEQQSADFTIAAPVPIGEDNQDLLSMLSIKNVFAWKTAESQRAGFSSYTNYLTDHIDQGSQLDQDSLTTYIQRKKEELTHEQPIPL